MNHKLKAPSVIFSLSDFGHMCSRFPNLNLCIALNCTVHPTPTYFFFFLNVYFGFTEHYVLPAVMYLII